MGQHGPSSRALSDTVRLALEVVFACWLLYYLIVEFSEMYAHKWMYWADAWNYIELANIAGYAYQVGLQELGIFVMHFLFFGTSSVIHGFNWLINGFEWL